MTHVFRCPTGKEALKHLLSLYETETRYSCFVLLSLEVLLAVEGLLEEVWDGLSEDHQLLCLEVVEAGLLHTSKPLSGPQGAPTLKFLLSVFKVGNFPLVVFKVCFVLFLMDPLIFSWWN